jgi:hypothetical protein
MALIRCPECSAEVSDRAWTCPKCGCPIAGQGWPPFARWRWPGYEWRSEAQLFGIPLVHVAFGLNPETGTLRVARGIVAIGQFGFGVITIAQFGIGILGGIGQFIAGTAVIGQFAAGILFALGQFAVGLAAIGQFAAGGNVTSWW